MTRRRNIEFRDHHTMTIAGVPHIVVLETIRVDVQAIGIHVHVGNKELCNVPSISLPF